MRDLSVGFTELRSEVEECGNTLALFVDIFTSELSLSDRGRLALSEYGRNSQARYEGIEAVLKTYEPYIPPS
jgi:hypothetical protein